MYNNLLPCGVAIFTRCIRIYWCINSYWFLFIFRCCCCCVKYIAASSRLRPIPSGSSVSTSSVFIFIFNIQLLLRVVSSRLLLFFYSIGNKRIKERVTYSLSIDCYVTKERKMLSFFLFFVILFLGLILVNDDTGGKRRHGSQ